MLKHTESPPEGNGELPLGDGEKRARKRTPNPAQELLRAKRAIDQALSHLRGHADLLDEAKALRGKVLDRWMDAERPLPEQDS